MAYQVYQDTITTPDGIAWFVQRFEPKTKTESKIENVILLPNGDGDSDTCKATGIALASTGRYQVMTMDFPGFSRTTAPREAYTNITAQMMAEQIATLYKHVWPKQTTHEPAIFWGSSAGAMAIIALMASHPELVKCAIVHEIPFKEWDDCLDDEFPDEEQRRLAETKSMELKQKTDEELVTYCEHLWTTFMIGEENNGHQKWEALGPDFHQRLKKNFPIVIREMVGSMESETRNLATPETLRKRPLFWTMGSLRDDNIFDSNPKIAERAGLSVNTTALDSRHYPQVTVPEQLAAWIDNCANKCKK